MNYDKITFDDIQIIVMTHNRAYLLDKCVFSKIMDGKDRC